MIRKAIYFATMKHQGQLRKCTNVPYIVHPMEVMEILTQNGCSTDTIVAGILHDLLEDTQTQYEEIEREFGEKIVEMVLAESENKAKSWKNRKQETIDKIKNESLEVKEICCADKLANLSSIYIDCKEIGDDVWKKFHAEKSLIQWYYKEIIESLTELENFDMFKNLKKYYSLVFEG